MCGITLSIYPVSPTTGPDPETIALHESLASSNANRGPDTSDTWTHVVDVDDGKQVEIRLTSSVLGLRGELTGQPIRGTRGVLAWNGQVFHGLDVQKDENDTMALCRELEAGRDIHELLSIVEGPYAFVYYEFASQTLTYQLDLLSRRALLQHLPIPTPVSSSSRSDFPSSVTDTAPAAADPSSSSTATHIPTTAGGTASNPLSSRYFALSSTRSSEARRERLPFRALGGGEGGVLELRKISVRQGGQRAEGVTVEEEVEMVLDGALRTWESHPVETAFTRIPPLNLTIPPATYLPSAAAAETEVDRFIEELTASVMRRVNNIPEQKSGSARAALLFSGGVDSTLLAYMLHKCLPPNEPIDLVNVAFQRNPDLPTDRNKHHYKQKNKAGQGQGSATGSKGSKGTKGAGADCKKGKGVVNRSVMEANGTGAGTGNGAKSTTMAEVAGGAAESSGSISAEGGTASPSATIPASESEADTGSASGSSPSAPVGSAVDRLASLSLTPPTNAASAVPRPKNDTQGRTEKLPNGLTQAELARMVAEHEYNVPDRIAGYEAVQELRACCERREFRFVTVDVTYAEYMAHREQVMDVMYPCTTEMDMSLAYPLYFASRGRGTVDGQPYQVDAKVYFSGLGPDEQLGGYSRHRNAYLYPSYPDPKPSPDCPDACTPCETASATPTPLAPCFNPTDVPTGLIPSPTQTQRYTSLLTSLTAELSRLPTRNTSRDDRALSHWARDARYPYLDLQFIAYLSALPIQAKVVYELGEGVGDKLLLRLAAQRVGLEKSAKRVKRAMQFGSRSAKVGGKGKGPGAGRRTVED